MAGGLRLLAALRYVLAGGDGPHLAALESVEELCASSPGVPGG